MPTITDGVDFDVIAREWRFKWSEDEDKVGATIPCDRSCLVPIPVGEVPLS